MGGASSSVGTEFSTLPLEDGGPPPDATTAWRIRWVFPSEVEQCTALAFATAEPLIIGRGPRCDVTLALPSVSREHVELRLEGSNVAICDRTSRNGLFVNGRRIARHLLREGDVIRVGECVGVVDRELEVEDQPASCVAEGFHAGALLKAALAPLRRLAATDLPVIVHGETGTGKERTARAIHEWSGRRGDFVAINCAALPEQLAEAELFGYRRGAFSGAEQASVGHLRTASGGTLFLDELVELSLPLQAKLLRAIELHEVQPLGESRTYSVDLRLVAAAQQPLEQAVSQGKFRADLCARLNGFSVQLPALRERIAELPSLFQYLLRQRAGGASPSLDARVIEALLLHHWPGNVREVDMLVRRLLGLHGHQPRLLPEHLAGILGPTTERPARPALQLPISADFSRDERDLTILLACLRDTSGNVAQAAVLSHISRQRAYRLLQARSGLDLAAFRRPEAP